MLRRSTLTIATQVVLVCLLVGAVAALTGLKKTVTLSVDGERRTVDTYARSVADVLKNEGIAVGSNDMVAPEPGAVVADGALVTYREGRRIVVDIDGVTREVWTTALDVDEAVNQLGLRASNAYVSVSRSGRMPIDGVDITVRTPRSVSVLVDGKRITATTTAASVADLLDEIGVTVGDQDVVEPGLDIGLSDGGAVTVSRVSAKRETRQVAIPNKTVRKKNSSLYKGDTVVRNAGKPGLVVKKFRLTLHDGKVVDREVSEKRKRKPVKRVIEEGTKERPVYVPVSTSSGASSSSGSGPNWSALARCESSGRPGAVSASGKYHGLYQFDVSTWRSVGGSGLPSQASPAEQTMRAERLYRSRGAQPWPVCGRLL